MLSAGYSDEEYESDPETKVKGPKPVKDGSEDSDVSFAALSEMSESDVSAASLSPLPLLSFGGVLLARE